MVINVIYFVALQLRTCLANIFNSTTLYYYHTCLSDLVALFVQEHLHRQFMTSSSEESYRLLHQINCSLSLCVHYLKRVYLDHVKGQYSRNLLKETLYVADRLLWCTRNKLFPGDEFSMMHRCITDIRPC